MINNKFAKRMTVDKPYAVYKWFEFEYLILKTYQKFENEIKNPYARWFCACKSPCTHGSWEYGDVSVNEVLTKDTKLIECTKEWREVYCNLIQRKLI